MPIISPPSDNGEIARTETELTEWEQNRRIELFLDVKPWVCPRCNGTNFGRNKFCADFRCKLPRPKEWKFQKRNA